jgi:hypothetical protein
VTWVAWFLLFRTVPIDCTNNTWPIYKKGIIPVASSQSLRCFLFCSRSSLNKLDLGRMYSGPLRCVHACGAKTVRLQRTLYPSGSCTKAMTVVPPLTGPAALKGAQSKVINDSLHLLYVLRLAPPSRVTRPPNALIAAHTSAASVTSIAMWPYAVPSSYDSTP